MCFGVHNVSYINLFILSQSLLDTLHDLLLVADPESQHDSGFAKRVRLASDSALLLSTTRILDDLFNTNSYTFPPEMQKQPPSCENIPAGSFSEKGLPASKRYRSGSNKKGRKSASTQAADTKAADGKVHSFLPTAVDFDVLVLTAGCTARALARFLGNKIHILMALPMPSSLSRT